MSQVPSLLVRDRGIAVFDRGLLSAAAGLDCCCGPGPGPDPCCGCGHCPAVITLVVERSWTNQWICGGSCDFTNNVDETMVVSFARVTDPFNACGGDCPDACFWQLLSGTRTIVQSYANPDPACGTDTPPTTLNIPVACGDQFCRIFIRCGACDNPPPQGQPQDTWEITVQPNFGTVLFQVFAQETDVNVCPAGLTWGAPVFPLQPNDGTCTEVQNYTLNWFLA